MTKQRAGLKTRRRRESVMGKILPPVEVNSIDDFPKMNHCLTMGPVSIVFISADWCGHCQEFSKHWKEAVESPDRSVQAVKLNEKVLSEANSYIQSNINSNVVPFHPEGYPSVIVVDKKGNTLTELEPRKDTRYLSEMMSQAGPLAVEAGLNERSNEPNRKRLATNIGINANQVDLEDKNSMLSNKVRLQEGSLPLRTSLSNSKKDENNTSLKVSNKESKLIASLYSLPSSTAESVKPPQKEQDKEGKMEKQALSVEGMKGGSLFQSLSQASYTLAPTAVLLATAATVFPRKMGRSMRKKMTKKRHVRKQRKNRTRK